MSGREYAGPLFDSLIRSKVDAGEKGRLWPSATHRADPATSRHAELEHTLSGMRLTHLRIVVDAVRHHPGRTARGLASALEMDLQEVRRRLTDAKDLNLVYAGAPIRVGHHKAESTWWPGP